VSLGILSVVTNESGNSEKMKSEIKVVRFGEGFYWKEAWVH